MGSASALEQSPWLHRERTQHCNVHTTQATSCTHRQQGTRTNKTKETTNFSSSSMKFHLSSPLLAAYPATLEPLAITTTPAYVHIISYPHPPHTQHTHTSFLASKGGHDPPRPPGLSEGRGQLTGGRQGGGDFVLELSRTDVPGAQELTTT